MCSTGWRKPAPNTVLGAPSRLPCPSHLLLGRQSIAEVSGAGSSTGSFRDGEDLKNGAAHLLGASELHLSNGPLPHGTPPHAPHTLCTGKVASPPHHSLLFRGLLSPSADTRISAHMHTHPLLRGVVGLHGASQTLPHGGHQGWHGWDVGSSLQQHLRGRNRTGGWAEHPSPLARRGPAVSRLANGQGSPAGVPTAQAPLL